MPGRNAKEARQDFLAPIERTLKCLTFAHRFTMREPASADSTRFAMVLNGGEPAVLRASDGPSFDLYVAMALDLVPFEEGQVRLSTRRYIYEIQVAHAQGKREQLVRWHWHPEGRSRYVHPHLHLPEGAPYSKVHVPSGRITFEDVVEFMICELRVEPTHESWQSALDEVRQRHVQYRSWHNRPPLPPVV